MPSSERLRPYHATCEDGDDDAQSTLRYSSTTANVSAKRSQHELDPHLRDDVDADGGDSGYASRAATIASNSTSSSRRKMPDLKVDTIGIPERERLPYSYTHSPATKQFDSRQDQSRRKEASPEKRSRKHKAEVPNPSRTEQYAQYADTRYVSKAGHTPPSPVQVRHSATKAAKEEHALPAKIRRSSPQQQPPPIGMLPGNATMPVQYVVLPTYGPAPVVHTPMTPTMPYNPLTYTYAPPAALPTPSYAMYQPSPPVPSYFDQLPEPRSARPSRNHSPARRNTMYGDTVIRQSRQDRPSGSVERASSKDVRPPLAAHRSSRSEDIDRINMPPPVRPQRVEGLFRRPSARRAKTYHPQQTSLGETLVDEDPFDSDDDRDYRQRVPVVARDRRESSNRLPPSSYRAPGNTESRPSPRKAVSYSAGTTVTKMATTPAHSTPRRMATHLEQKVTEVEDYTERAKAEEYKRSRAQTSSGLTTEALRKLDQRTTSSKSETGSNFSHQSSKDSSGRARSHTSGNKTSISVGGVTMTVPSNYNGRPVSMNIDGLVLSLAPEGKENERPQQKRIERAPSTNSRASKKSVASSVVSSKDRGRDMQPLTSRRPSQHEERGPSVRSSRQPSRAPSQARRSTDYASRRQSVDYSRAYNEFDY